MANTALKFSVNAYNQLPQLDEATANLERVRAAFDEFVREASMIVTKSNLGKGQIGAFLLHRHWKVTPGSLMVERPRLLESGKIALVTAPTNEARARLTGVEPSRWAAPSAARPMEPLEFSADAFVIEIGRKIATTRGLIPSLARLVSGYNLQRIIGFMVVPRKGLSTQRYPDFVETNFDNMSIVTGERLSARAKREVITTGWPLASTRMGTVFACCYCSHPGGGTGCRHPKPDPPVCKPHGCV